MSRTVGLSLTDFHANHCVYHSFLLLLHCVLPYPASFTVTSLALNLDNDSKESSSEGLAAVNRLEMDCSSRGF